MNKRLRFGALLFGFLVLVVMGWQVRLTTAATPTSTPANLPTATAASPWRSPVTQASIAPATVWNDLANAQVIYLGEVHDRAEDHRAQLEIIQTLHQRHSKLAIGMEMFQRPYQAVLDQYLAGTIDEATLRQQSDYDRRWGFDWEYYAPLLRFAKANQLPVIALNVPTEVTQQVARNGLAGITERDRQWVPHNDEIRTDNVAYRALLQEIYESIHQGRTSSFSFANFELAQVLWDETMADAIADFYRANPDRQVVVLAGRGHINFGYGIPDRVRRRLQNVRNFQQRSILLNPDEAEQQEAQIADYFWITPASAASAPLR